MEVKKTTSEAFRDANTAKCAKQSFLKIMTNTDYLTKTMKDGNIASMLIYWLKQCGK